MTSRLVTVGAFDRPAEAHIARNALEGAGIQAVVTDEESAGVLWHIAPALSGAKVQVMEEDVKHALAVLEKELDPNEGDPVSDEEPAAAAGSAGTPEAPPPEEPDRTDTPPSERDEYARRLVHTAVFALGLPPLWFYAMYLFLNAAFAPGPISEQGRKRLVTGGVLIAVGFFTVSLFFTLFRD